MKQENNFGLVQAFRNIAKTHQESCATWSRVARKLVEEGFVNSALYWQQRSAEEYSDSQVYANLADEAEALERAEGLQ